MAVVVEKVRPPVKPVSACQARPSAPVKAAPPAFTRTEVGGGGGGRGGAAVLGTIAIALTWALSTTVVRTIEMEPPVTCTGKLVSSAVSGGAMARMSKRVSACG